MVVRPFRGHPGPGIILPLGSSGRSSPLEAVSTLLMSKHLGEEAGTVMTELWTTGEMDTLEPRPLGKTQRRPQGTRECMISARGGAETEVQEMPNPVLAEKVIWESCPWYLPSLGLSSYCFPAPGTPSLYFWFQLLTLDLFLSVLSRVYLTERNHK